MRAADSAEAAIAGLREPGQGFDPIYARGIFSARLPPAAGGFLCWHKESHQRNAFP
jgi:hypothetical protein